jgi:hypothetical protein
LYTIRGDSPRIIYNSQISYNPTTRTATITNCSGFARGVEYSIIGETVTHALGGSTYKALIYTVNKALTTQNGTLQFVDVTDPKTYGAPFTTAGITSIVIATLNTASLTDTEQFIVQDTTYNLKGDAFLFTNFDVAILENPFSFQDNNNRTRMMQTSNSITYVRFKALNGTINSNNDTQGPTNTTANTYHVLYDPNNGQSNMRIKCVAKNGKTSINATLKTRDIPNNVVTDETWGGFNPGSETTYFLIRFEPVGESENMQTIETDGRALLWCYTP